MQSGIFLRNTTGKLIQLQRGIKQKKTRISQGAFGRTAHTITAHKRPWGRGLSLGGVLPLVRSGRQADFWEVMKGQSGCHTQTGTSVAPKRPDKWRLFFPINTHICTHTSLPGSVRSVNLEATVAG